MTRSDAIDAARLLLSSGEFLKTLDRRVGFRTESQNAGRADTLRAYLEQEMRPAFAELGFTSRLVESPSGKAPFLVADYREDAARPTVLMYGHGDVVDGMVGEWRDGLDPWRTTPVGNRVYGRGTADNKGQHSINLAALGAVRAARGGKLGFNAKFIVEMGERSARPTSMRCARACAMNSPPICFSAPTARACRRNGRPSFSAAAAESASISTSTCARAGIIPAIGAACWPTPPPSSPTPSRPWSMARAGSSSRR
jgi:acetylornithine deacetylase/succinyl-diaminopimelate desuccinylase-like protein